MGRTERVSCGTRYGHERSGRTGLRGCVTIIDRPPRNARSAGAREARRHRELSENERKKTYRWIVGNVSLNKTFSVFNLASVIGRFLYFSSVLVRTKEKAVLKCPTDRDLGEISSRKEVVG